MQHPSRAELLRRQTIAERLVGLVQWVTDAKGFARCPNEHNHTDSSPQPRAVQVCVDGGPNFFCLHTGCTAQMDFLTRQLQEEIFGPREHTPRMRFRCETENARAVEVPLEPLPKWPPADLGRLRAAIKGHGGLVDLWESSPIRPSDDGPMTEEVVDLLFKPDDLICVAIDKRVPSTEKREDLRGELANAQLIVPNTMTARQGLTREGKISSRCLNNVGARKFLVVELDLKERNNDGSDTWAAPLCRELDNNREKLLDVNASVLMHLARLWPLCVAVFSGGKSLHGWFAVRHKSETLLRKFFAHAASIGADPGLWSRIQLVRMPDGIRLCKPEAGTPYSCPEGVKFAGRHKGRKRQKIYFIDPENI